MSKVKLISEWMDDHILCCTVDIDGETTELLWCGWEGLAAALYAHDSPSAMQNILQMVKEQKEVDAENRLLDGDDGTP